MNDTALITHHIGITRRVVVAAVSYFHDRTKPITPEELINHNCIVYTRLATGNQWHFQSQASDTIQVIVKGNFQVDNSALIREAVLSGIGIAVCLVWLFGELINSDYLTVILKDYQPVPLPIYAVYRRGRFIPAKVCCFIEYLTHEFKLNPWVSNYGTKVLS